MLTETDGVVTEVSEGDRKFLDPHDFENVMTKAGASLTANSKKKRKKIGSNQENKRPDLSDDGNQRGVPYDDQRDGKSW